MNYIVFDLEWNQSDTGEEENAALLPFEIIEIGAVKLNNDKSLSDRFEQLVRPQVYKKMHYVTQRLIRLQMEELEKGIPFQEAVSDFLDWCGEECVFCSWGPSDLTVLQRNMRYYHIPPLGRGPIAFYDVQKLFSLTYGNKKSRYSLEYAVDFLGIEKDIPFHRAYSDAYYTAKVFRAIRNEKVLGHMSYDVFSPPECKEKEIFVVFDDYAKYITREFNDKDEIIVDKEVMSSKCYLCHKNLKKKMRWFTPNGKHYYCLAECDKHGLMKFKIRIRRSENDKLYAVKTMKYIGTEEADKVKEKKEHVRELRKLKRRQKHQNKDTV